MKKKGRYQNNGNVQNTKIHCLYVNAFRISISTGMTRRYATAAVVEQGSNTQYHPSQTTMLPRLARN
jgi:hypothetical protein